MTEYTKADYLAACEALFDDKPTEYYDSGKWLIWPWGQAPTNPADIEWRPVDPLREYREAFAAGKRVEWHDGNGVWWDVKANGLMIGGENPERFRIVEPKTVKLYPFAVMDRDMVIVAFEYKTSIDLAKQLWPSYEVYPINPDGSIEVES